MNLLDLVRAIAIQLGIVAPAGVIGNQDRGILQIHAYLNQIGNDLTRQFDWQQLAREFILQTRATVIASTLVEGSRQITMADTTGISPQWGIWGTGARPFARVVTVDSPTQITMDMPADRSGTFDLQYSQIDYPLPADWRRQVPQTEWDRTNRWPLMGPQTAQSWQSFKSGIVYAGPRQRFRIMNDCISINPPPPDGLLFAYEYVSKNWVKGADGGWKNSFTADTDTCIYDDSLLISGAKAKWFAGHGMDSTLETGEFNLILSQAKAQDKSAPALSISPRRSSIFLSNENISDGNWGRPQW